MSDIIPAPTPGKTSILDIFHKGIYPAVAILISTCVLSLGIYTYCQNTDKQRQIDRLKSALVAETQARLVVEENRHAQEKDAKSAEEQAHKLRVEVIKRSKAFFHYSNSPMEEKAAPWIKGSYFFFAGIMRSQDAKKFGEEKAKVLWDKAAKDAEKVVAAGRFDWLL